MGKGLKYYFKNFKNKIQSTSLRPSRDWSCFIIITIFTKQRLALSFIILPLKTRPTQVTIETQLHLILIISIHRQILNLFFFIWRSWLPQMHQLLQGISNYGFLIQEGAYYYQWATPLYNTHHVMLHCMDALYHIW